MNTETITVEVTIQGQVEDLTMKTLVDIPGLGPIPADAGMIALDVSDDGYFQVGQGGVISITSTGDRQVAFIAFQEHTLARVKSAMGYPAYYPVHPVKLAKPVRAVLMDLDGTSVRSEEFWIGIVQLTTASLLGNPHFELEESDLPHVSGYSVSEHLQYCIRKYCPKKTVEEARYLYFEHTHREMQAIAEGHGRLNAFRPTPGLAEFLLELKARSIKIGLVTSGLYEKAWPEILAVFRELEMGNPVEFYDAIISAGFALRTGQVGTLGELAAKPHPWLYAEAARVGLGIPFEARDTVVGLEDSGAGVCAIRLAGFTTIGLAGGSIIESGTRALCARYCRTLTQVLQEIL